MAEHSRVRMRRFLQHQASAEYTSPVVPLVQVRHAELTSATLEAYRGTVDDEGETLADAAGEIEHTLSGRYGPVIWQASGAVVQSAGLQSAIIVTCHHAEPMICYVFTVPSAQRHGFAAQLIEWSCERLLLLGHHTVDLSVTVGNSAARLYQGLGFNPV